MSLAGRVAVVTGGAHGIGAAIADALAADGAKVHRVDKQLTALDGSALTVADLTDSSAVPVSSPPSARWTSWSTPPAGWSARSATRWRRCPRTPGARWSTRT